MLGAVISEQLRDQSLGAGGVVVLDLPVNTLSAILLELEAVNATANDFPSMEEFAGLLSRVRVTYRGHDVISLSGEQLLAVNYLYRSMAPVYHQLDTPANSVLDLVLPVVFGRGVLDAQWGMPPTKRGELQLEVTAASSLGQFSSVTLTVTTVEWPGVESEGVLQQRPVQWTPPAVGLQYVDLPVGQRYAALLLRSPAVPGGTSRLTTVDRVELIVDGLERVYTGLKWEVISALARWFAGDYLQFASHDHLENLAAAYTQYARTASMTPVRPFLANWSMLLFDSGYDGSQMLDASEFKSLRLGVECGDTNAVTIIPLNFLSADVFRE